MSQPSAYTVLDPSSEVVTELTRKKSRFLTVMQRVSSSHDAQELVDRLRSEHRSARHHCSAWSVGHDRMAQRAHDDGEPSGTAGSPMLDAINKAEMPGGMQDLSDVCIVVVRWFGGTLLGAGGLVSAYSDSVVSALDNARAHSAFRVRQQMQSFDLSAPMTEVGRWEHELRAAQFTVQGIDYTTASGLPRLNLVVPDALESLNRLSSLVAALSGGTAELLRGEVTWSDLPADY